MFCTLYPPHTNAKKIAFHFQVHAMFGSSPIKLTQFAHSRCERGNIDRKLTEEKCNLLQFIIWCFLSLTLSELKRYKKTLEVYLWIDIFERMGEFMLWFMTLFFFLFWGREKNSSLSLKCLLLNSCRVWVDFLCVCLNSAIIAILNHKLHMKLVHVEKLFKGSINSTILSHWSRSLFWNILPLTHTHVQSQEKRRKAFTSPTYNISSKKSRQQICHVDEQTSTHTQSLMTCGKKFCWPFERNVTLYLKPSNRLNKVSHQVKQFANGVILTVFI